MPMYIVVALVADFMHASHDFETRVSSLQRSLGNRDIDVAVVLEPRDQLYLTGIGLRGAVLVPADAPPVHLVQLNVDRAREESAIDDVRPSRGLHTVGSVVAETFETDQLRVGIEADVLPVEMDETIRDELPMSVTTVDVTPDILELRRRKSGAELERMDEAAQISRQTFDAVPRVFESGLTELELKSKLQLVKRGAGAEDGMWSRAWDQHLDFGTLVAGPNTAVISGHWVTMTGNGPSSAQPYGAGHREITPGDLVIVDHQTVYEGYHVDEARTFVVGDPTDRHRDVHRVLEDALGAAAAAIEPGNPVSAIYDAASEVVEDTPYAEGFMGLDQVGFEYVGHMVGLNADETPLITPWEETHIEPGMTFAVEPKIIFEGEEGLTLEDTIVATETGSRRLTTTPRKLFEL
jgi:Xaa-Pro aminopeptidase